MRYRPLNRHDAWRAMPQTLLMRGIGVTILAACGLAWPDLALTLTIVDAGIVCIIFALVDLLVAAAIRRESGCSARKIGALGFLGIGCGSVMVALPSLPLASAVAAVMIWLVMSGATIALWGASFLRRARSSGIVAQFSACQFTLAFALVIVYPVEAWALFHAALVYTGILGIAQVSLGVSLRRREGRAAEVLEASG